MITHPFQNDIINNENKNMKNKKHKIAKKNKYIIT